jgi:hypothetical protein
VPTRPAREEGVKAVEAAIMFLIEERFFFAKHGTNAHIYTYFYERRHTCSFPYEHLRVIV